MSAVALVDRVFFVIVGMVGGAWDFVVYRTHPHIAMRSVFVPVAGGFTLEVVECWCGCRATVRISRTDPLPVSLPRSSQWSLPPVEGWPQAMT